MLKDYKRMLEAVRKYTGKNFTAKRGYAANKKPNFGRQMAVLRYFRKVEELTLHTTFLYKPKKGEKREVFRASGQKGYNKFTLGILPKFNDKAELKVTIDRKRPIGSRVVLTDTRPESGQRFYQINANEILDAYLEAENSGDEPADVVNAVLEEYAPDAEFFLIRAGDYHIWHGADGLEHTTTRILGLMDSYSAANFDPTNKNSHWFGNWFRGVTAFTSRFDAHPYIAEAAQRRQEFFDKRHVPLWQRNIKWYKINNQYHMFVDGVDRGPVYVEPGQGPNGGNTNTRKSHGKKKTR